VGSSSKNANFILDKLKIQTYFDVVIDGNGVRNPKPDPEVFINGAKALDLSPAECLVFEDAASGIAAAKAGGFTAVGVGNPHIAALADIYLNDLTEFRIEEHA
jgi:beta-phosphoglucomutase